MANNPSVKLTFFVELEGAALEQLFSDPSVTDNLVALNARISLGVVDFTPERAEVVRRLNQAGVPVVAWQLLPREQGYWYNMCNAEHAMTRYKAFRDWSVQEKLQWSAVGIDIEPDIAELQQLFIHKSQLIRTMIKRGCGRKLLHDSEKTYQSLVTQMRSDGYHVHAYEFPFMVDEHHAGSSILRRLFGVSAAPSDQRVLMLYTSFFRPFGPAFLWSYAVDVDSVAVGITGGGVEIEGVHHPASLSWDELSRDLRLALRRCDDIHIFSLEGCIEQGYFERLHDFDWEQPVKVPHPGVEILYVARTALQTSLWLLSRPVALVGALACVAILLTY
ncbi:MAG: hypothetical protein ABW148_06305 [Sedimenticola sp.]